MSLDSGHHDCTVGARTPEPHEPGEIRQPIPPDTLVTAGELLRALSAPIRIAIVLQLRESARCVHELVGALGVTQPLISQHLRVLKTAGVVRGDRSGREVLYRLADEHLAHIVVDAVAHAQEPAAQETIALGTPEQEG
ncbi:MULTISPECIES: metalloregulator ArsR/SmtB family transcription factor [unclassified Rhodococcus (in: high G+C Gram-positive bacteria)]|uniref:ArsR/SmtB family transcription factor n=1 Tax=Rhodococcus sp. SJ-3 TaxID=3454628 RepID=UPI003F79EEA7